MIVSEARREANRRNAQLSTGPKTEAGKDRSRRNALTHGLSAEVVHLPEDRPTPAAPGPIEDWSSFLIEQVGVIASQLGRSEKIEDRHRDRIARRAELFWEDDRRMEAEILGSGLARDPAAVALSLRRSPQGCDWMAERWALLARAADRDGGWTAEQRSLAFDLLGRPVDLRGDDPSEAVDLEGRPTPGLDFASLARREVAALVRRKADLADSDRLDRRDAQLDPDACDDPDLRKLRRHESDLHRRLRWCVAQIAKLGPPPSAPPQPPAGPIERRPVPAEPVPAPDRPVMSPAPRPDPKAARDKAREAARRIKRERRRS